MTKTAFIFPGQGSQFVGMGKDIYEQYPEARQVFNHASDVLDIDLKSLCFQDPEDKLKLTTYTQPAILTTSLALLACIGNADKMFLAGHSLGEFTALAAGGGLDIETAVSLVMERGRFMQEAVSPDLGGMAAIIGLDNQEVSDVCSTAWEEGKVWPANYNCPGQVVVTGEKKGLRKAIELAKDKGAKLSIMLPVSIPSHCLLMEPAATRLAAVLEEIEVKDLEVPVISNCWAIPIKEKDLIKKNMVEQMTSPVQWEGSIRFMIREGVMTFIEVGPGKVLTGLIKRIDRQARIINISDSASIEKFKEAAQ
jgi:[acyl-carrier-protein] S-malonyltransferase